MDLLVTYIEHTRSRLVEGHTDPAGPEDVVRSVEWIVTKCREKRPHRKTHGRISFGDLARTIADKWKTVDPQSKAIFNQYAEIDMIRYRKEVKIWKDKKERELEAASLGGSGSLNRASFNSMNNSFSTADSASDTELRLNDLPSENPSKQQRAAASWQPRNTSSLHESLNSSYSSVDSLESEPSLEPMPIKNTLQLQMQMQIQIQMQQMQMQQQQIQMQQTQMQQQQQHYPHAYQQHQANSQANFIANANQRSMTSFPALLGGGYGNAPFNIMSPPAANYGNGSNNSLAPNDALLGISTSQVSDYTSSSHTPGHSSGNFSSTSHVPGNWGP